MTVGSHNVVKFTVIKPNCQKTAAVFLLVVKRPCTQCKVGNPENTSSDYKAEIIVD